MTRHFRLYLAFLRNCVRQAVEFKANFWANVFTNFGWIFALAVFIAVIFNNTKSVAGWNESQMLALAGVYAIVRGISDCVFYGNLSQMPTYIGQGTMDFILTKPVSSQFYVSLRFVKFEEVGQLIAGFVILGYALAHGHAASPSPMAIISFLYLLLCAVVLFYSMNMLLMTMAFWLVRLDNLMVLGDTVFSIARNPVDIWGVLGVVPRFVMTYVVPIAFLASFPVEALFGVLHSSSVLVLAAAISLSFFVASVLFWGKATRSYSSASS